MSEWDCGLKVRIGNNDKWVELWHRPAVVKGKDGRKRRYRYQALTKTPKGQESRVGVSIRFAKAVMAGRNLVEKMHIFALDNLLPI